MQLSETKKNWDKYGEKDPMWAILTYSPKSGWTEKEFFETGKKEINNIIVDLKKTGLLINFETVLDFGCGIGRLSRALVKYFDKVFGVDISIGMINEANRLNKNKNVKFYLNDQDNLNLFKDNSIDFVYSSITLQHISPAYSKKYIKEFIRIIKKGGIVVFQIPEKAKIFGIIKKKFEKVIYNIERNILGKKDALIMEMNCISFEELKKIARENNSKIITRYKNNMAGKYYQSYTYFLTK